MRRILVVDDEDSLRLLLGRALQKAGYEVVTAANGAAALQEFRAQPADLVITDLVMPEKEGIETILELRQLQPALKIIAMSGGGYLEAQDYLQMAGKLGAMGTLTKPFTAQRVQELVAELLQEPAGVTAVPA